MEFHVCHDEAGQWHWEALSSSGASLVSGPTYLTEAECRSDLENLKTRIAKYHTRQRESDGH